MPKKRRNIEMENPHAKRSHMEGDVPIKSILLIADIPYQQIEVGPRPAGPLSPPPAVQFVETDFDFRRERRIGTLVLTEEKWNEWFDDSQLYPQYRGGWLKAAEALGKDPFVVFGCPLCPLFRTRSLDEVIAHSKQHGG